MNILITGANGFIGKALATSLSGQHRVWKLVRTATDGADTFAMDLTKPEEVKKAALQLTIRPDVIIHCASQVASEESVMQMDTFYQNTAITESMIHLARHLSPARFIHISSVAVYPHSSGTWSEESPVQPSGNADCLYGLSKFCSEVLFDFYLKPANISVLHLRLAYVTGEGMRDDRIYTAMLKQMRQENKIEVWGNGKRVNNFIRVEYLVSLFNDILQSNLSGVYNMGERNISYEELAREIIEQYGNPTSEVVLIDKGRSPQFRLDCTKLTRDMKLNAHD